MTIKERKMEHIKICIDKPVDFNKTNGFEKYDFVNNALPEINFDEIDISTKFLGKKLNAPIIIEAITGGFEGAAPINKNLAKAAEKVGIVMGLGSQRAMIDDPNLKATYYVRDVAPNILLLGNIGGFQLAKYTTNQIKTSLREIRADALAIHINSCHEISQREGDRNAKGILQNIEKLCKTLEYPVIVKEVGCGISGKVAKQLENAGVDAIDVAGAGGTSWVKVETFRKGSSGFLGEWGIPTAECLEECVNTVNIPIIASGGMRTGLDFAKAIAMGADLVGFAKPLLKPALEGHEKVIAHLERVILELKKVMFLLGAKNIEELKKVKLKRV